MHLNTFLNKNMYLNNYCLNNNFQYLNTKTRISITFFNSHVFSQYLDNDTKNF